jgi:hypothetical protein
MRQHCETCGRRFDDEYHSTICPHRGIGFCAVCDCAVCNCVKKNNGDWERTSAAAMETPRGVGPMQVLRYRTEINPIKRIVYWAVECPVESICWAIIAVAAIAALWGFMSGPGE